MRSPINESEIISEFAFLFNCSNILGFLPGFPTGRDFLVPWDISPFVVPEQRDNGTESLSLSRKKGHYKGQAQNLAVRVGQGQDFDISPWDRQGQDFDSHYSFSGAPKHQLSVHSSNYNAVQPRLKGIYKSHHGNRRQCLSLSVVC